MTEKTLAQLNEERIALDRAFAALEFGPINTVLALLNNAATKKLRDAAETARDQMPDGEARNQMNNIVMVIDGVTVFFTNHAANLSAKLGPAEPTPAPEAPLVGGEA